jgi:pilus assembly protein Flp/PilA
MNKLLKMFQRDERGVTAVEYAILAGIVIAVLVGVGAGTFKTSVQQAFTNIGDQLETATEPAAPAAGG